MNIEEALLEITPRLEAGEITPAEAVKELVEKTGIPQEAAFDMVGDVPGEENFTI